jgi:hypothetical protein
MMTEDYPRPLLERVSCAIDRSICPDQWLHQDSARAAIREVAAAARAQDEAAPEMVLTWAGVAEWLEHEAGPTFSQEDFD